MSKFFGITKHPAYLRGKVCWERQLWRIQQSGRFIAFIVYSMLFLDNMLLTVIVPIIPDVLLNIGCKYSNADVKDCGSQGAGVDVPSNFSTAKWYEKSIVYRNLTREHAEIGFLFASKALVQMLANPLLGILTNRIGYTTPLCIGSCVLLTSSLLFAFGESYALLFVARGIQGIGSACVTVAGMGMIADRYQDDKARSKVMGVILGAIALGVLAGYPFGGVLYDIAGKSLPLGILSAVIAMNCVLQLAFLRPRLDPERLLIGDSVWMLMKDPYILLACGAICVSTSGMAVVEPCLPIWLKELMSPPAWQLGTTFIPDSLGYLLGTNIFGGLAFQFGRYLSAMVSLMLAGICAILIPFSTKMSQLLLPHFGLGFGIGITDAALMPLLAYFVDTRHVALYGSVYAIAQTAVSLAYSLGPLLGSQLMKVVGFHWIMWSIGILNLAYCPLCFFLRKPSLSESAKVSNLEEECSICPNQQGRMLYSSLNEEN